MNTLNRPFLVCIKLLAIFVSFFTNSFVSIAQTNTSYNSNSVPIGGTSSVAFGIDALRINLGLNNTANGYQALYSNDAGSDNTASGYQVLYNNSTGSRNTGCGASALFFNTEGNSNTANGYSALGNNRTGNYNTANGADALGLNSSGTGNSATGAASLLLNNSGNYNTGIGNQALYSNKTGDYNSAVGFSSLGLNSTGIANNAIGSSALISNTTGNFNAAIGYQSLFSNSSGSNNVAVGDSSGYKSLGSGNIFLGKRSGYYESGDNKLYIGNDSNKTIFYGDLSSGQVLLGKKQPTGYSFKGTRTLNVLGGILSDSIRIALSSGWADYVFNVDYKLRTLAELEIFIKNNNHLPNIPPAEEIAANGVELGMLNSKLLEKIEELTLYILQQQKQIQTQHEATALLKTQLNEQKRQIGELQKLLK